MRRTRALDLAPRRRCRTRRRHARATGHDRGSQAARPQPPTAAAAPSRALAAHPGAARATAARPSWSPTGSSTPTAPPTSACDRTYRGLPVLGGDLVVHRAADGALARRQPDPAAPLHRRHRRRGRTHRRRRDRRWPPPRRPAPSAASGPTGTPQLVVDATGATPRLAWEVVTGGTPGRRHAQPAGDVRRRPHRRGDPARAADRDRRRLGPVALQRHRPAAGDPVRADVPAQGRRRRGGTVHDRHEQHRGLALLPDLRHRLHDGHAVHQPRRRRSATARPATASRPPPTRSTAPRDVGLLQERARPQRHLRQRHAAPTTGSTTAAATSTPSGTAPR